MPGDYVIFIFYVIMEGNQISLLTWYTQKCQTFYNLKSRVLKKTYQYTLDNNFKFPLVIDI